MLYLISKTRTWTWRFAQWTQHEVRSWGQKSRCRRPRDFFFILCEPSGAVVGQNATLMFLFYPILHLCKPLHFQKSDKYWHEQKRAFIPVTSWWYPLYARQTTIKFASSDVFEIVVYIQTFDVNFTKQCLSVWGISMMVADGLVTTWCQDICSYQTIRNYRDYRRQLVHICTCILGTTKLRGHIFSMATEICSLLCIFN